MTLRLWPALTGEDPDLINRSKTGVENDAFGRAWASHYVDRGLLLLTIGWLALRIRSWMRLELRPESLYEPQMWLGKLVFPELPDPLFWYSLVIIAFGAVLICLVRPRWLFARIVLAASLLLVIAPGFGFGHLEHTNHLFLMAHVYSIFRPAGRPRNVEEAGYRAQGYTWFLLGLLAVYTASGLWKVVDMTIRDVIKPGVTWLEPEAMLATTVSAIRTFDLPMTAAHIVDAVAWIFPFGYIVVTLIFSASFLASFRRPLLVIVLPLVAIFHLLNAVTFYALFLFTIVVAVVVFLPYDFFLPDIKKRLVPIKSSHRSGSGADSRYERVYENGDVDSFRGFYAYREEIRDRSVIRAALLYYPGIASAATYLLQLRKTRASAKT